MKKEIKKLKKSKYLSKIDFKNKWHLLGILAVFIVVAGALSVLLSVLVKVALWVLVILCVYYIFKNIRKGKNVSSAGAEKR